MGKETVVSGFWIKPKAEELGWRDTEYDQNRKEMRFLWGGQVVAVVSEMAFENGVVVYQLQKVYLQKEGWMRV